MCKTEVPIPPDKWIPIQLDCRKIINAISVERHSILKAFLKIIYCPTASDRSMICQRNVPTPPGKWLPVQLEIICKAKVSVLLDKEIPIQLDSRKRIHAISVHRHSILRKSFAIIYITTA
ncbi:uncharacterized protein LOC114929056 [Nylanderia fulva]|uniref:uncharacterized protein LOC114929056 n=1 Tax=Nylanderia fulva TaxID=613905 RepID=UPI0010FB318E|nr:uncharacterized protein LOC114929056 [Nylanderia fulva]